MTPEISNLVVTSMIVFVMYFLSRIDARGHDVKTEAAMRAFVVESAERTRKELDSATQERAQAIAKETEIARQLNEIRTQAEANRQTVEKLSAENVRLTTLLQKHEEADLRNDDRIRSLEQQVSALSQANKTLTDANVTIIKERDAAKHDATEATRKQAELQNEVDTLRQQLVAMQLELDSLKSKVERMSSEQQALIHERDDARAENARLKEQIAVLIRENTDLQQKVETLTKQIADLVTNSKSGETHK